MRSAHWWVMMMVGGNEVKANTENARAMKRWVEKIQSEAFREGWEYQDRLAGWQEAIKEATRDGEEGGDSGG